MKKYTFLSILLTYTLTVILLAGCSQSVSQATSQPEPTQPSDIESNPVTPSTEHEVNTIAPMSADINDYFLSDGTFDLIGYCEAYGFKVTTCEIEDTNEGAPGPPNPIWLYSLSLYRDYGHMPSISFSGPTSLIPYTIVKVTHAEGDVRIKYESIIYPSRDLFEVQYMVPPYRNGEEIDKIIEALSDEYIPIISECEPEILLPADNVPIIVGILETFLNDPTENPFLGMEYGAYTENFYHVSGDGRWINNNEEKSIHDWDDVIFLP